MGGLSFSDRARRSMWRIVPKRAVSRAIGWGASRGLPVRLRGMMLSRFARAYSIDLDEAEKGADNAYGFHHENSFAGSRNTRTQLHDFGTLWMRAK